MAHNPITNPVSPQTLATVTSGNTQSFTIPPHREPLVVTVTVSGGGSATVGAYGQVGALIQT
jgi:hypothetical protein